MIKIKRVYEQSSRDDGLRILVDRLWPRGVKKEQIDLQFKEIAPTNELRKWFNHDPKKWLIFKKEYAKQIRENKDAVKKIRELEKKHKVLTLLYAAKDEKHNHALVIKQVLK